MKSVLEKRTRFAPKPVQYVTAFRPTDAMKTTACTPKTMTKVAVCHTCTPKG